MGQNQLLKALFVIAIWMALAFGFLEGVVFLATNPYPLIRAAHKVSFDVLWIAPVFDALVFLGVALALLVPLQLFRRVSVEKKTAIAWAAFTFVSVFMVVTALSLVSLYGAAVFAAGVAAIVWRIGRGRLTSLTALLSRRLWVAPLLLASIAAGVFAYDAAREWWLVRGLPPSPPDAPNVLIIVLDTVRDDRFERGDGASLTPNIDGLAQKGIRYANAWSSTSWSLPSQFSILTGRFLHNTTSGFPIARIEPGTPSLQSLLGQRGYVTGAFSSNAAWITPEYLGRGFLRFRVYQFEDYVRRIRYGRVLNKVLERLRYPESGRGKEASKLSGEFLSFLDEYRGRPFFSYLCYMDVNRLMHKARAEGGSVPEVIAAYDRAMAGVDAEIGRVLGALQERGLLENTLIILTSDHGESFGEQSGDHDPDGHGTSLYPEQSAVPLFLIYPPKVPGGMVLSQEVSIIQIPSTVMGLLGVEQTAFRRDPLPLDSQPSATSERVAFIGLQDWSSGYLIGEGVAQGRWLYVRTPRDTDALRKGEQLFRLADDPRANVDLSSREEAQAQLEIMRNRLDAWRASKLNGLVSPQWHYIEHEKFGQQLFDWIHDQAQATNLAATPEGKPVADRFAHQLKRRISGPRPAPAGPSQSARTP